MATAPLDVFVSYSRRDERALDQFRRVTRRLQYSHVVNIWDDTAIRPGTSWAGEVSEQLDNADIVVLLVTPNLLDPKYWVKVEWPRIAERVADGQTTVLPVLVHQTDLPEELADLSFVPTDGPIADSADPQGAWIAVGRALEEMALDVLQAASRTPVHVNDPEGLDLLDRPLDSSTVVRTLKAAGFDVEKRAGEHYVLRDDSEPPRLVFVPRSSDGIDGGLLRQILRTAGVTEPDFLALMVER